MATVVREGTTQTKVLIIGAGIAGISSAEYLAKNGFTDFKIIEAADRIGGRIWTHEIAGTSLKVEMGANWIHGIERNPIYQIADENGLLQLRYKDKGLRHRNVFLTETGVEVHSKTVMECDFTYGLLIQQCEEFFQMSMPTPYEIDSVGDYMDVEIEEKLENFGGSERKLREMIFNQHIKQETVVSGCNDLHEVSLSEFGCYEELPGVHYTIPPGFQSVLDILLGKVPENNILLNHTVKSIRWGNNDNDGHVLVECENGKKFCAERIIWTCSLGVLKASCDRMIDPPVDRMFDPPLPKEKRDAIERLGFGIVDRLNLIFDDPIVDTDVFRIELLWDDESYSAENRNPDMSTLWYRKLYSFEVVNDNLLSGYLCGKEALYMESLSEDQIAADLRGVLEKFLNKHIPLPTKVVRSRWGNSKNTRGSYCYIKVGATVGDVETLAQPICDNNGKPLLQFAGEATHSSFYSTTHGALLTGHREAKRILDLYGIANSK